MPDIGPGPQNPILGKPDNLGQLPLFMQAIRTVESGGNYSIVNSIGCKGAYQFCPGTSMYAQAAASGWTQSAQDQIAAQTMTAYFNGPAKGSWYNVAEAWNGGPGAIGNTALVGGYASKVMSVFASLGGQSGGPSAYPGGNPSRPGSSLNPLSGITSSLSSFGHAFTWLTTAANWVRIGEFVLGVAIGLFAVMKLFSGTSTGRVISQIPLAKAVGNA